MTYNVLHPLVAAVVGPLLFLSSVGPAMDQSELPGEFAIQTLYQGTYLTARNGGNQFIDAVTTNAKTIGPNERFKLSFSNYPNFQFVTLQTANGNYVAPDFASDGLNDPDRALQALNTVALSPFGDEHFWRFTPVDTGPYAFGEYTIQMSNGHFLTALGGGNKSTAAFHIDATNASLWEVYTVQKCGDLGSNFDYAIRQANEVGGVLTPSSPGGGFKCTGRWCSYQTGCPIRRINHFHSIQVYPAN